MRLWAAMVTLLLAAAPMSARAQTLSPDLAEFRSLYKELVEINTTQSVGDCTRAANAMAARLRAGGIPESAIHIIVPPGHERRGNLVAVYPGSDPNAKPILLLAHIDVVEANRKDWQRDPFKLVEEDGFFWGRGTADDKAMAAIFTDMLIRFKKEGYRPKHTLKLALTCGEETPEDYDGARYLLQHDRPLIDAAFAINENGSGVLDKSGKRIAIAMQAGQKVQQHFRLTLTDPGGFSSGPPKNTAIYQMAEALLRLRTFDFPLHISASTHAYLEGMSKIVSGETAAEMRAMLRDPPDPKMAAHIAETDPRLNAMLRTTCVAVKLDAGEAESALPRRASALLDCHIAPNESVAETQARLQRVLSDPKIAIAPVGDPGIPSPAPPMSDTILGPAREVAAQMWPGVPLIPYQVNGADDGRFLTPAGIPTYGLSGLFRGPGGEGAHGLNERIRVKSLYEGREFLYRVVKRYADAR
jgi:acetylornithine deacetylase/succinyl-diaminopimelate desuccinylase-like protein